MTADRRPALAAVLAGGAGTRLGGPKAAVEVAGRPLIAYPLAALREAGLETVVVAKRGTALPQLDVPVWTEPDTPRHPLTGVVAALHGAAGRPVLAVACDMPLLEPGLLRWLAERPDPLVAVRAGGRLHPFPGLYGPGLLPALQSTRDRGDAIGRAIAAFAPRLVDEAQLRSFGDPGRLLANVNTPADVRAVERQLVAAQPPAGRGRSASP